jgi:hypothetical protein
VCHEGAASRDSVKTFCGFESVNGMLAVGLVRTTSITSTGKLVWWTLPCYPISTADSFGFATNMPYAIAVAFAATMPSLRWFARQRRLRAEREGGCVHCHYNLTGNVSGVCPECGSAIAKPVA